MTYPAQTPALDPTDVAIGGRIRARREARNITQAQLAAAAGVTFQQIQKYERGVNRVAAARLLQIARALKTTGADLLGELETGEGDALSLARPGATLILSAFNRIDDDQVREAALILLEQLAAPPQGVKPFGRRAAGAGALGCASAEAH